jgi:hypothetical protein
VPEALCAAVAQLLRNGWRDVERRDGLHVRPGYPLTRLLEELDAVAGARAAVNIRDEALMSLHDQRHDRHASAPPSIA